MDAIKVGIREFRSQLPHYLLEVAKPVVITRHGETVGYYIPSRAAPKEHDIEALKLAAAKLDQLLKDAGVDVEQLVTDFDRVRRQK